MKSERADGSVGRPRVLLTGAAGFVGSTTAERLLETGCDVVGIDVLNDHYDPVIKQSHLVGLQEHERFEFVESDLATVEMAPLLDGVDTVIHLAALAGVRTSWASQFAEYATSNVVATQRILQGALEANIGRVVYASSSSIYGNAAAYPVDESALPAPHSPYGATKLAGEHLCCLYAKNFGLSTVSLRYFTVYGPRQRPDMAIHRLIECALLQRPFPLFGDGSQERDFTFVDDVVEANLAATSAEVTPGLVANVAGGGSISMIDLIALVEEKVGCSVPLDRRPASPGDVQRTGGSIERARQELSWKPQITVEEGVERQVEWHLANRDLLGSLTIEATDG